MTAPAQPGPEDEQSFSVLNDYLERLHAGGQAERDKLLAQYPHLAPALECLEALGEQALAALGRAAASPDAEVASRARQVTQRIYASERRQAIGRLPRCVGREPGVEFARDEPEIGSRKLPLTWHAFWIAQCSELLEMRELAHVHFRGELTADRLLERLAGLQSSAWK